MNKSMILYRIEKIERELEELKSLISDDNREAASLRGMWKGANITDEEIEEVKRSLFKGVELYDEGQRPCRRHSRAGLVPGGLTAPVGESGIGKRAD